jgi:replicative DNA helicase
MPTMQPPTTKPKFTLLGDLIEGLEEENAAILEAVRTGKRRGPVTGLEGVDETLGGFLAPGVHILKAAPGDGKTAFCLQAAGECGFPALYVTAEMLPEELFRRTISRVTGEFLGNFKKGMDLEKLRRLAGRASSACPRLALLDATCEFVDHAEIGDAVEALMERTGDKKALIVLDSLQDWSRSFLGDAGEYEKVTAGITAVDRIAKRLRLPVLAISHRNRMGNKAGGSLHDGKSSGDIEYKGESVLDLKAEEKINDHQWSATLTVQKNRHGQSKVEIPLVFEGRIQKFTEP